MRLELLFISALFIGFLSLDLLAFEKERMEEQQRELNESLELVEENAKSEIIVAQIISNDSKSSIGGIVDEEDFIREKELEKSNDLFNELTSNSTEE